jgi:hypothetical protein
MFQPGQKVVCIDGRFPLGIEKFYRQVPIEGNTYTIRDIVPGISLWGEHGEVAAYLVEIAGPLNAHGIERGFNVERFAPLNEILEEHIAAQEATIGAV